MDDFDQSDYSEHAGDEVFSRPIRAGKRTYFFDVKATKNNDLYLTITESKRRIDRDGHFVFEKHKIFLYKEDFEKFTEGLNEVVDYVKTHVPDFSQKAGQADGFDMAEDIG
ncbi:MAG: PUR family DNA/RNA-binding protein [Prevotellaceae bacterium]|nr:PUR family DNA/RNA-binding protein [Prevotellaceae bacterium]